MNILLIIICLIAIIILIILIAASFSPTNWSIETSTTINKPKQVIYDYIKNLRNSEQYNKWVMTDPNMKKTYKGTDATVGYVYGWESENKSVGQGEQEITNLKEGERIDYEIRFKKPFEGISSAAIWLEKISENETKVSWSFSSTNTFMMKIFHVVMNLKKVLLKDLATSLGNLKTIIEK